LCLPPARTHFWQVTARVYGRGSSPRKVRLNWTIPALVNSRVGSSLGSSDDEGTWVWPRDVKKSRNRRRISADCIALKANGPRALMRSTAGLPRGLTGEEAVDGSSTFLAAEATAGEEA